MEGRFASSTVTFIDGYLSDFNITRIAVPFLRPAN